MINMEYAPATYFREHGDDEVRGFTILSAANGTYELAEKWLRSDGDPLWHKYSVSEEQLLDRVSDGLCEKHGTLTERQFKQVKKAVGFNEDLLSDVESEEVSA